MRAAVDVSREHPAAHMAGERGVVLRSDAHQRQRQLALDDQHAVLEAAADRSFVKATRTSNLN
jgi:hypothetical protein